MRYLSLFSGIGGFELGITQAYEIYHRSELSKRDKAVRDSDDHTNELECQPIPVCVGYSEIDKYASQIYQSHFPNHQNYGDITKINETELPDFDMLVGGFPCQSFSIAGKRGGFNDTRGTLFFDIARILKHKQPKLLLLENVKGLLSHDEGRTFATIIATLDELGYDLQWQVLNSKNFDVPQNRERVFIVGHLRGTSRPEVFPIGEGGGLPLESVGQGAITGGISSAITSNYKRGVHSGGETYAIQQLNKPKHSNDRVYGARGVSPTLNTMQGGNRQPKIIQRSRGKNDGGEHDIAPTLSSKSWPDNNHLFKDTRVRRLTPVECERLQGFPDGWTGGVSDTQRYKCLGNAVTVNVIQAIMERLSPFFPQ